MYCMGLTKFQRGYCDGAVMLHEVPYGCYWGVSGVLLGNFPIYSRDITSSVTVLQCSEKSTHTHPLGVGKLYF